MIPKEMDMYKHPNAGQEQSRKKVANWLNLIITICVSSNKWKNMDHLQIYVVQEGFLNLIPLVTAFIMKIQSGNKQNIQTPLPFPPNFQENNA